MNNVLMPRDQYLNRLIELKDRPVIKTITGIRRCGKSSLLLLYRDYLLSTGIENDRILMINLTHHPYSSMSADEVYDILDGTPDGSYILLDEIQTLDGWDKKILTIFENKGCDIYLTGSNSTMFSSQLSTLLSGRSINIEMTTFSYNEFLRFTGMEDSDRALMEYMRFGGFPLALMLRDSVDAETATLEGIYDTVVVKDIMERHSVRNPTLLRRLSAYMMRNIGKLTSIKSIRDYLNSSGNKVNFETVDDYLGYLEEAFTFYRIKRYNIKAKDELVINDKFYLSDLGLRRAVLGERGIDIGSTMENLVYLELKRRGYTLHVGKMDDEEVDFIATNSLGRTYIQVTYSLRDSSTEEREIRPLRKINDNHRKVIIVMERSLTTDREGIEEIGLNEFLLGARI